MSQILQLTDEQLIMYGAKAYKDGFIAAKKEELELHKKEWVNEDEAMKILHCKKPTLAKYRSESVWQTLKDFIPLGELPLDLD